jgi:hypothetical protein
MALAQEPFGEALLIATTVGLTGYALRSPIKSANRSAVTSDTLSTVRSPPFICDILFCSKRPSNRVTLSHASWPATPGRSVALPQRLARRSSTSPPNTSLHRGVDHRAVLPDIAPTDPSEKAAETPWGAGNEIANVAVA